LSSAAKEVIIKVRNNEAEGHLKGRTRTMNTKEGKGWNPYFAGALTGLLMVLSVAFAGRLFGVSTTFARAAGMVEQVFDPGHVAVLEYFTRYAPKIDWQFMFVIGIVIGSFISATTSRTFHLQAVPDMWQGRFGSSKGMRAVVAFIGGTIALYGARLAGG
jgi:hypothetical protein